MHFLCQLLPRQAGAGMACRNSSPRAGHQQEPLLICQLQIGFWSVTVQMFTQQKFGFLFLCLILPFFLFISPFSSLANFFFTFSVASTRNTPPCPWGRVREGTEPSCVTGDQTEVAEFLTAPGVTRFHNTSSFFTCISTYSLQKKLQRGLFCKN